MTHDFKDDFDGNDEHLLACIEALLDFDAAGAIVPHGLGGHGRSLLSAAAKRLQDAVVMRNGMAQCIVP